MCTSLEAKRFFVDRIVAQATAEGQPLTAIEVQTLGWSESEPSVDADLEPVWMADAEAVEQFQKRVMKLLSRSYKYDVAADRGARLRYRQATQRLARGILTCS